MNNGSSNYKKNNTNNKTQQDQEKELDEVWWVDYLEKEMNESFHRDCEKLLKKSTHHRKNVEELKGVKHSIEKKGDESLPTNPRYYASLHDRIMNSIEWEDRRQESSGSSL